MPRSMKALAGLLPTAADEEQELTPKIEPLQTRPPKETSPQPPNAYQPSGEICTTCGFHWKSWCGFESSTWQNIAHLSSCPKTEDTPIPSPGFEELYGQEALRLCKDCLMRHQCSRFVALAWCFPGCPDFKREN
jgi:hypothetical protein